VYTCTVLSNAPCQTRLPCFGALGIMLLLVGCASTPLGRTNHRVPSATPAVSLPDPARPAFDAEPAAQLEPSTPLALPPNSLPEPQFDIEPKVEPISTRGANKPYVVLGRTYVPYDKDRPLLERGIASWYGKPFHGRRTANGEIYNMHALSAAHKTMPLPSYAKVRNPQNGREVIVRINDRGPFHGKRIIDLSHGAAMKLGISNGLAQVEVERLTHEQIRSGAWRNRSTSNALRP
jgi:rare lipoprotein A (peptidoglycan hydrolase)